MDDPRRSLKSQNRNSNMANPTVIQSIPAGLSDYLSSYDSSHWGTVVAELKPASGTLTRGTILSLVAGKLEKVTSGNQASAYGVLLDESIDTAAPYTDGSVTGSIARAGSFRGPALTVSTGVDATALTGVLRDRGIFIHGPINVPA
jgi:hypothetical protein